MKKLLLWPMIAIDVAASIHLHCGDDCLHLPDTPAVRHRTAPDRLLQFMGCEVTGMSGPAPGPSFQILSIE